LPPCRQNKADHGVSVVEGRREYKVCTNCSARRGSGENVHAVSEAVARSPTQHCCCRGRRTYAADAVVRHEAGRGCLSSAALRIAERCPPIAVDPPPARYGAPPEKSSARCRGAAAGYRITCALQPLFAKYGRRAEEERRAPAHGCRATPAAPPSEPFATAAAAVVKSQTGVDGIFSFTFPSLFFECRC